MCRMLCAIVFYWVFFVVCLLVHLSARMLVVCVYVFIVASYYVHFTTSCTQATVAVFGNK